MYVGIEAKADLHMCEWLINWNPHLYFCSSALQFFEM